MILGYLDDSEPKAPTPVAEKVRDLTISWTRYGYRGPILAGPTTADILAQAADLGQRFCFIIRPGCIVSEAWRPFDRGGVDFWERLERWAEGRDFHVAGWISPTRNGHPELDRRAFLVDVPKYRRFGEARLDSAGLGSEIVVYDLGRDFEGSTLDISAEGEANEAAFGSCLGPGVVDAPTDGLSDDQRLFLDSIRPQADRARRGVFLWNIEPYHDVRPMPRRSARGLGSLYAVAAGFKPNWILHVHGFDESTRVVFFDYSPKALEVRRFMTERWDGVDFPRFVRTIFDAFPEPSTFYQLWGGLRPADLGEHELGDMWRRELDRWGGEREFREHWRRYRALEPEYVDCDLMANPSPLLDRMGAETPSVVWWSNAFFTMLGNWSLAPHERRGRFESWMRALATRHPEATLYGTDDNNMSINNIRAADYWDGYSREPRDAYRPHRVDGQAVIRV